MELLWSGKCRRHVFQPTIRFAHAPLHLQPQAIPISFSKANWLSATELGRINLTFSHVGFKKRKWKQLRENTGLLGEDKVLPAGPRGSI